MAVKVAVKKENLVTMKGPQVDVVFARSGSEGLQLQGSSNTDFRATTEKVHS
jgi:hypothetical protein